MQVVSAQAGCVRSALSSARKLLGIKLQDSRETIRSGGEDGLYRCHLTSGHIVEVTIIQHSKASAELIQ